MRLGVLKTLLLCCCMFAFVAYAQPPGHPPPPPPGAHPPPPPPPNGSPSSGNTGSNGGSGGTGGSGAPTGNVTTRTGIKLGPPGRWWDDNTYVKTLGLSRDQQKKMDSIFNANRTAIVDAYKTFLKQQATLQAISTDPNVDKAKLFAAIDAVNQARAALEKANTQMLLQIRQQLDAAQVAKLETLP
jgi:Spy/CpxP family protein refolding chaperone